MKRVTLYCLHDNPLAIEYEGIEPEESTGSPGFIHWELDTDCPHGCEPSEDAVIDAIEAEQVRREDLV